MATESSRKASNKIVFNKTNLDKIPFTSVGEQAFYYDTKTLGFGLRVGAGTKTYILNARIKNGRSVRVSLGRYGVLSVDQARDMAIAELQKLNAGVDPNVERKQLQLEKRAEEVSDKETVAWLLDEYENEHLKKKKKSTKPSKGTERSMKDTRLYLGARTITILKQVDGKYVEDKEVELSDWLVLPYRSITRQMIYDRFMTYAKAKPLRTGKVLKPIVRTHQIAFRFLRAAFNYAIPRAMLNNPTVIIDNPVDILSTLKLWEDAEIRERLVDFNHMEFSTWWKAVEGYQFYSGLVSDYLLFSLLQSGRSIDVAPLKWNQVDMKKKEITYNDTKNGEKYTFPITKHCQVILERRRTHSGGSDYVFAYSGTKSGYVSQDCKFHFKKISEASGKLISHHDLRRTWGSAARMEALNIDDRTIDYCLKHTHSDVNQHYFMKERERILSAFQKVEDYFFAQLKKFDHEGHGKNAEHHEKEAA